MQFRDLQKQYRVLQEEIDQKIQKVCVSAHYISGPEVKELEKELTEYVGVTHCIACANGTDAITLAFKAWGFGEGDAVFVPDFTFFSSGECPASLGCTCIFVDVDPHTFNLDADKLEEAILEIQEEGKLIPKAVIAVDLFGLSADYEKIRKVCRKHKLMLLEDGAQGFGGEINGKKACSFGDISTTSFFPAKPLGCYGDGGAVFTNDDEWAKLIRSYAVHGKSPEDKYDNIRIGLNSRLDTVQAAILQVKLKALKEHELEAVNQVAGLYTELLTNYGLDKKMILPTVNKGFLSSWAQYTVRLPKEVNRNIVQQNLKEKGIPTMVYYPKPMHTQLAFQGMRSALAKCPWTEQLCNTVLSLPLGPYMEEAEVKEVVHALCKCI